MQALTLPARRGWRWLRDGFMLFCRQPLLLSLFIVGYWITVMVASSFPFIGQPLATLLIPVFSVSLMNACRLVERGAPLPPQLLFSGFQNNLRTLLVLGALYIAGSTLILAATSLADGGELFRITVLGQHASAPTAQEGLSVPAILLAIALFLPLMMAYWYAPVLAAWHGLSAGKSLFFSVVACARNWRPFVAYFVAVAVLGVLLPGIVLGALTTLFPEVGQTISMVISSLLVLVLMPTLYGSFYASYRDVFVSVDANA